MRNRTVKQGRKTQPLLVRRVVSSSCAEPTPSEPPEYQDHRREYQSHEKRDSRRLVNAAREPKAPDYSRQGNIVVTYEEDGDRQLSIDQYCRPDPYGQ